MKVMWEESKGKSRRETVSLIVKNSNSFPFPLKVKNSKITENFTHREKVGKTPRFSREGKMYSLYREYKAIFPDGQRGKERWA